jgi:hypothetical protein
MYYFIGFSDGNIANSSVGDAINSFGMPDHCDYVFICGKRHQLEWPEGVIKPEWKGIGDVVGSGLLLNPKGKLEIFFTLNGVLMGRKNLL